ncbi:MAG: type I methionyl aminopeptidase [Ignavibacteria bacterium]|jgi:methionyl aminopeptidase|nr:type I methionyl aminopeptidase [Ignavibacteria bacterium]
MSLIKTQKEIGLIKESCKIVSDTFKFIKEFVKEGITTEEIDKKIENFIISKDAYPAFKGYRVDKKSFPSSSCISVNEEVVHGLPGKRVLKNGDIVSIDVGVKKNGYYGDGAYTFAVGEISPKISKLLKVTQESLFKGIAMAVDGNEVNDISVAIQNYVEGSGYGIVRELVGHGIGKNLHEEPAVPNFYSANSKQKLFEGMVLAIEPMVNYGTHKVYQRNDGWTISTKDESPSAHFEHTVLVSKGKAEILTI